MQTVTAACRCVVVTVFTFFSRFGVMQSFSNDSDLLKYEAVLFTDLYFPWQVLREGTSAVLSGTMLTASGEDFSAGQVAAGGVVYLRGDGGKPDGAYEIVSVDAADTLTVSVLRADSSLPAVGPGDAANVSYRVSTFAPQAKQVLFELTQYFGIGPGDGSSEFDVDDVVDTAALRLASVYAVIANVYATLAGSADDEGLWKKREYYQRLFEKGRERCRISLDAGDDGVSEKSDVGASIRLVRK